MLGGDLRCKSTPFRRPPSVLIRSTFSVHLERKGSFTEDTVRIYVAEIGSALSFLHEKRIIHRYVVFALLSRLIRHRARYRTVEFIQLLTYLGSFPGI